MSEARLDSFDVDAGFGADGNRDHGPFAGMRQIEPDR